MKTHQLADSLALLSRILKAGPNIELEKWSPSLAIDKGPDASEIGLRLTTLAGLSRISKAQWRDLITGWGLPIEIKSTYSARDVVGHVMNYLAEHPEAAKKMHTDAAKRNKKLSPKLMDALSVLLGSEEDETKK